MFARSSTTARKLSLIPFCPVDINVFSMAPAIGRSTMAMVTISVMPGRVIGHVVGRRAEMAGDVVLIGIGSTLLAEHLKIFS
ncbi:manganese efflux pump [Paraburkholderia sediminicola]|uniref:manganese efflux pump n=1 Tax=Paraburkholderia sediminicola TaxID=458836 RepID=UPI0038B875A5